MKAVLDYFKSTQGAIVIGAILISIAILFSNGVLKFKPATVAEKTPNQKLTELATTIGLDKKAFGKCLDDNKFAGEISKDISDAQAASISGTPGFVIGKQGSDGQVEGIKISGAYPYQVFQLVLDKYLSGQTTEQVLLSEDGIDLGEAQPTPLKEVISAAKSSVDDDPSLGDSKAAVTMIEFSDYECPFCKRHFLETYPQIKSNYIDNSKIRLVYRDFIAVTAHNPWATYEANAADCARELGGDTAYFKMHDAIFNKTGSNGQGF